MKTYIKITLSILAMNLAFTAQAQKTDKKVKTFTVERIIKASADKVWDVVGNDYGAIANSHPKIVSSEYNQGHITGGENATRTCNFNEEGTKFLQEKQIDFSAEQMTFKVLIYQAGGLPLDADYNYAIYQVIPIDDNSCKLVMDMGIRTKPAFMGALVKGNFKKTIADYMIAVEHHVLTGENVNEENFAEIKKKYQS